jgi:hypothetical protein
MPGATPAGGTAVASGDREGLAIVHVAALGQRAHLLLEVRERRLVFAELHAERLGEALGGEVVVRGAEPAPHHEQVGPGREHVAQRGREALTVVGDHQKLEHLDAAPAQVVADEGAVGVAGAAVEQFVAAEDDGGARRPRRHQALVPGMRMTPRAFRK